MNLRYLAEQDLGAILEDSAAGFGWDILVTPPGAEPIKFTGFSTDIAQVIDPETGLQISGRLASVGLRISSLKSKGLDIPQRISDTRRKPWVIEFLDINGEAYRFTIIDSNPDRAIGMVTLLLEVYN